MPKNVIGYNIGDKKLNLTIENNNFLTTKQITEIADICEKALDENYLNSLNEDYYDEKIIKDDETIKEFYHSMSLLIRNIIIDYINYKISLVDAEKIANAFFPNRNEKRLHQLYYFKNVEEDLIKILYKIKETNSRNGSCNCYKLNNDIIRRVKANKKQDIDYEISNDKYKKFIFFLKMSIMSLFKEKLNRTLNDDQVTKIIATYFDFENNLRNLLDVMHLNDTIREAIFDKFESTFFKFDHYINNKYYSHQRIISNDTYVNAFIKYLKPISIKKEIKNISNKLSFNEFIDRVEQTIFDTIRDNAYKFLDAESVERLVNTYLPNFKKGVYPTNISCLKYIQNNADTIILNIERDIKKICKIINHEITPKEFLDVFIRLATPQLQDEIVNS